MHFKKNDKIDSFTVVFPHKQGAYAETYRVRDADGKTRFLKLINNSKLNRNQIDDEGRVVEVEATKQLKHHNLCRYIDSGSMIMGGSQYTWIVTEFVSGETLSQRIIRDGNFSVYEIKTIAKSVLSALLFLHSLPVPIIHNEVTIQNVLLNLVGDLQDLKLIDFGKARFLNQRPAKPNLEDLNPFYLAPERFSGVSSVQTDLYSVGVMMYQLLYGELPWFIDIDKSHNQDDIDSILSERDKELELNDLDKYELDDQLKNTIAKALSYDAEDRFQTADEFIKAIDGEIKVDKQSTKRKIMSQQDSSKATIAKPTKREGKGFAAIAGMDNLKRQMMEEIIEPLNNPEEYRRYGVTIPNGMLLYGPPGCGKTFFAKHFAEEAGFNFICITPATLKSRYVNATQENIAQLFKDAEENAPTIIFIDEINELVPDRHSDVHEMSRSAVNEMLAQMDRTGEKGVFVVGATNYPDMIDPAILRSGRLENKYYVGVPDKSAREALFKLYLSKRPYDFGLDYSHLADLTANYVSADISKIVNDAARKALKSHSRITMQILEEEIEQTTPSLTASELEKYDKMRQQMEGKTPVERRPRIGFE